MSEQAMVVGPGTEREYVTLGRRLLAAAVDNSVWLCFYLFFFAGVVAAVGDSSQEAAGVLVFAYLSLWFNYFAFSEWRWGQTIGKNATGIMVTSLDGSEVSFGQASIRNLLRLIDWLVIGWVMIATGERKQRLGDRVANTVVVRRPRRTGATIQRAPALTARQIAGGAEAPPSGEAASGDQSEAASGDQSEAASGDQSEAASGDQSEPASAAPDSPAPPGPKLSRPGIRGRMPDITWSLKDTIWGLIGGLILALLSPILVLPFDPDFDSDGAILAAQGVFGLCLILVPIAIASRFKPGDTGAALKRLGLRSFAASALGWMLLALFAYYVAAGLFSSLVLEPKQEDIGGELGIDDEDTLIAVLAVVTIVVLAPIGEELFFRGFFFSGLRSRMSVWPAALISGLVFGSVHAPTGITTVIPLAALGIVLAWLYDRTGSLWPCVIAHTLNNALALALLS
jgi:membrane protease YdiL (CAAX protease family)/uncharacterized RDD family membrane protein YckC